MNRLNVHEISVISWKKNDLFFYELDIIETGAIKMSKNNHYSVDHRNLSFANY